MISYKISAYGKRAGIEPVQAVKLLDRAVKSVYRVKTAKKQLGLALQEAYSER